MADPRLPSINKVDKSQENLPNEMETDATEDQNTEAVEDNVDPSSLLTLFTQKYPNATRNLREAKHHYQGLKEAQSTENLISQAGFQYAKGLYDVYLQDRSPNNRAALTEFAVALGIPKFAYEIIVHCRNNYKELTSWDREKDIEQRNDEGSEAKVNENQVIFYYQLKYKSTHVHTCIMHVSTLC